MSYIEQTRKEIIEAYVFLRTNNMKIPSETLEFMKDSSLKALDQALTIPVVSQRSELLKVLEYTRQIKNNPKDIQLIADKLYIENL